MKIPGFMVALSMAIVASCSGSDGAADADVMFAQMMIPHHEQAIELADIALDPTVEAGDEVRALATRIKGAQDPEVAMMTSMLDSWSEPLYMDEGMNHSSMMSGMVSSYEMERLGTLRGTEFDAAWLAAMIAHHEGAIDMAEEVLASGEDPATAELAQQIIDGQTAEIDRMTSLLNG